MEIEGEHVEREREAPRRQFQESVQNAGSTQSSVRASTCDHRTLRRGPLLLHTALATTQRALQAALRFTRFIPTDQIHLPRVTQRCLKCLLWSLGGCFIFVCASSLRKMNLQGATIWQMKVVILVKPVSLANLNHQWYQKIKGII